MFLFASAGLVQISWEKQPPLQGECSREAESMKKEEPLRKGKDRGKCLSKRKLVLFVEKSRKSEAFLVDSIFQFHKLQGTRNVFHVKHLI